MGRIRKDFLEDVSFGMGFKFLKNMDSIRRVALQGHIAYANRKERGASSSGSFWQDVYRISCR